MPRRSRSDRTHPLIWCVAVICTFIAVVIIIAGVVTFAGFLFLRPKIPTVKLTYSHLDAFLYDQAGLLNTHLTLVLRAENDNIRARASFTRFHYELSFHGILIAKLNNEPFTMGPNSTVDFRYPVESDFIPLDPNQMAFAQSSLAASTAEFRLAGYTRTWWRVGLLISPKYFLKMDCRLRFQIGPGDSLQSTYCSYERK